jgi:hypothetical protein
MDDGERSGHAALGCGVVWGTGELTLVATNLSCRTAASPWLYPRWRRAVSAAASGGGGERRETEQVGREECA